jgi:hypothetical protein
MSLHAFAPVPNDATFMDEQASTAAENQISTAICVIVTF